MVRNDQEATRLDALYMPPIALAGASGMADAYVEQGVTKVNRVGVRLGHSKVRSQSTDSKGRAYLCPSVTLFVSFAVADGAHPFHGCLSCGSCWGDTRQGCSCANGNPIEYFQPRLQGKAPVLYCSEQCWLVGLEMPP